MVINKTLKSGVKIVMEQIPYVNSVSVGIWVRAGAVDENEKYSGISHYIEHMMFKGTEKRSAREIAADIDKIGGQINAFTGKEATCYYVKTVCDNYHKGAEVLIDMLENSLFDKKEMDKERQVICEEIKMTQDAPDDLAHETITSLLFKGHPLGKSIIGTPTSLKRVSRNVMTSHIREQYTRDSIVISIAGNFDPDEVCDFFDDKLLSLKEKKEREAMTEADYEPAFKVITKDIEQSHICMATKGIPLDSEKYYAFAILNNVMGGSMSSRFFQNIREEKGLAYSVYSVGGSFTSDGYYNIYAGVSHDKIRDAIHGVADELKALASKGITKEELDSSREQLKSAYVFGQENVAGRMFSNGKNTMLRGHVDSAETVLAGFDNTTMEDIENIKSMICDMDKFSAVVVTKNKIDLKKIMRG